MMSNMDQAELRQYMAVDSSEEDDDNDDSDEDYIPSDADAEEVDPEIYQRVLSTYQQFLNQFGGRNDTAGPDTTRNFLQAFLQAVHENDQRRQGEQDQEDD